MHFGRRVSSSLGVSRLRASSRVFARFGASSFVFARDLSYSQLFACLRIGKCPITPHAVLRYLVERARGRRHAVTPASHPQKVSSKLALRPCPFALCTPLSNAPVVFVQSATLLLEAQWVGQNYALSCLRGEQNAVHEVKAEKCRLFKLSADLGYLVGIGAMPAAPQCRSGGKWGEVTSSKALTWSCTCLSVGVERLL